MLTPKRRKNGKQIAYQMIQTQIKNPQEDVVKDEITKAVILDLAARAKRGLDKYNTTLGENNHQNMLQHAYEEALDMAQYLKKEITTLNTVQDLVKQYPNNAELGMKIREIYG
jgi:predicted phage-related endonuclease